MSEIRCRKLEARHQSLSKQQPKSPCSVNVSATYNFLVAIHFRMIRIGVIGSGPGAMYTVKYLLKQIKDRPMHIDVFEKLGDPFGLVRFGVAPDHVEVKEVSKEFKALFTEHPGLSLHLGSEINKSKLDDLCNQFDAVLVASGAQGARRLPFANLPKNTMTAQDFVLWYNGHPERSRLELPACPRNVSIVGHGNVAFDVARILSKSPGELLPLKESGLLSPIAYDWLCSRQSLAGVKTVSILGRGGYTHAAFTNKEFRELTHMHDATCKVNEAELDAPLPDLKKIVSSDRAKARGISILSKCASLWNDETRSNSILLRFFSKPLEYIGNPVEAIRVEKRDGSTENIETDFGIESIGFKVTDDLGLPLDSETGGVKHDGRGRVVGYPNLYVAGWAKRGPKGVIAANVPCCIETAEAIAGDLLVTRSSQ
jgi:ferredoxin--NADP+ reductase